MTAPLLQDHYDVPVIVVSLDVASLEPGDEPDDPRILVRLQCGARTRYEGSVLASEMRLAPTLAAVSGNAGVGKLDMPARVIDGIAAQLKDWPRDRPVWLRLGSPSGHLPAVPWEHLLQRKLGVPMLRLPEIGLPATPGLRTLEIVVCASASQQDAPYDLNKCLTRVVDQVRDTMPGNTRLQVFTDDAGERARLRETFPEVVVHTPPSELRAGDEPQPAGLVENGWLRWMIDALGDEAAIDIVHFVCPAQLTATFGSLKLDDPICSGPLTAWLPVHSAELVAFLTCVGASAVAFTIPSTKAWPAGIRMLAHCVMMELTGPVLVDAPHHDKRRPQALGAAYRLLFGPSACPVPRSPGLATYVHPQRVAQAVDAPHAQDRTRAFEATTATVASDLTLASIGLDDVLAPGAEAPRWLGANQRVLEQIASEIIDPLGETEHRVASDQGVKDALVFLKNVLAKDVGQLKDSKGGGPESW
jgi:hypothetical protein